ncbi:MAG TPA: type I DNA topoisomerase, partial [Candidatus Saccharimonadales bacterium]|nr:type I DNA topoisomerase [Candidatus Saccharimonadales bacterium]
KGLNVDVAKHFEPTYEIPEDKKKVVNELKTAMKGKDVWLASDEDREGEAIAWHLTQALNLDTKKTKRIVFHEITKTAIEHAIENPRTVDIQLVEAQQARRVLDRLVGYELSPVLWKKVQTGLSAGRVQSVAVRIIVEREREIRAFEAESTFKVVAIFKANGDTFSAELINKIPKIESARKFLESVKDATFTVEDIAQKPGTRNPGAPFTTSTLQQEASRKLGYSVRQTMTLAQRLYEAGHITYMRTDSTTLSGLAIKAAEDYIKKEYGDNYHYMRQFKTKVEGAQEAHEAIRPTNFNDHKQGADPQQIKLYDLIWRRALASQMAPAQTEKTEVTIGISDHKEKFLAKGEILRFDGFLKVYGGGKDDTLLPAIEQGQKLPLEEMRATETFTKPPARFSEAALVKKMEELGIGRPSTYAPTIHTIQTRGYIEKKDLDGVERIIREIVLDKKGIRDENSQVITGADQNKLVPTSVAEVTTDFLVKYFPSLLDYDFTATVEDDFDKIADGKETWTGMLSRFYKDFHPLVEKSEDVSREEVSQAREIGKDPKSGKPIIARLGRYGPMLQRGEAEDEVKPDFAPLPADTTIETVTLEQAIEMFKLPRVAGHTKDGQEIIADIGRFGPYIRVDKTFVSIKDHDPFTIGEKVARELYEAKLKQIKDRNINEFPSGIKVLNGPYGPYVTDGKKNARIPKEVDAKKLTEKAAKKLLDEAPVGKRRFRRRSSK